MPTMTNKRTFSETGYLPLASVNVPKKPMMNDPRTLIMIVPHGRVRLIGMAKTEMIQRLLTEELQNP
jgi:hypothetical protein